MVERYIEVTDEYVKQLEQEIDNLKKINEKHKKLNGELREENKKQKEVIDKAIEFIESKNDAYCIKNGEEKGAFTFLLDFDEAREFIWELLDILKESGE